MESRKRPPMQYRNPQRRLNESLEQNKSFTIHIPQPKLQSKERKAKADKTNENVESLRRKSDSKKLRDSGQKAAQAKANSKRTNKQLQRAEQILAEQK